MLSLSNEVDLFLVEPEDFSSFDFRLLLYQDFVEKGNTLSQLFNNNFQFKNR